jgi:ABC-type lipoprotein release transport system permease subunit
MLYGIEPNDPFTIFVAAATLIAVAVPAGLLPARRASRAQPMDCLRVQ